MASLFTARRKPKRIVRDEPDTQQDTEEDSGPVVIRPTTNAPKTKSKLRVSFNPGNEDADPNASTTPTTTEGEEAASQPTKLSRISPSNAAQSLLLHRAVLPSRDGLDGQDHDRNRDRPTYSKAYLDELRNSTPTTPRDLASSSRELSPSLDLVDTQAGGSSTGGLALDLESKFGKAAIISASSSRIPTAAEIREKKERRARLAKEQAANATSGLADSNNNEDFISLEDYDSDGEFKPRRMQVGSYVPPSREREKDTRLVRDDEDFAEGFDEFVEDSGRVTLLSRKTQREQTRKERETIRSLIDEAEGGGSQQHSLSDGSDDNGSDDDDQSDSEYERHQLYESAQTHRAMDGLAAHAEHTRRANRPRQPRHTTAIPKLGVGLARLRDMVSHLEFERARLQKRRADIVRERADVKASQAHIQTSLEEAGKELERVTQEHHRGSRSNGTVSGTGTGTGTGTVTGNGEGEGESESEAVGVDVNGHHLQFPPPPPTHTPTTTITMERGLESFGTSPGNTDPA